jgi:hypothetical protein
MEPEIDVMIAPVEDNISVLTDAVTGTVNTDITQPEGTILPTTTTTTTLDCMDDDVNRQQNENLLPINIFNCRNNQPLEDERFASPSCIPTDLLESPSLPKRKIMTEDELNNYIDNGYDSDGFQPGTDGVYDGDDIEEEEGTSGLLQSEENMNFLQNSGAILTEHHGVNDDDVLVQVQEVQVEAPQQSTGLEVLTEEIISKMKVVELRSELEKRAVTGLHNKNKNWLANRLRQFVNLPKININNNNLSSSNDNNNDIKLNRNNTCTIPGFEPTAQWVLMEPNQAVVPDPTNLVPFRAPNTPDEYPVPKHNYDYVFQREEFKGLHKVQRLDRFGKVKRQSNTNFPVYEEIKAENGAPKQEFINKYYLSINSTPNEWFCAFLPKESEGRKFCTKDWMNHTNTKSKMVGAGTKKLYPGFVDFSSKEIDHQWIESKSAD